MINPVQYLYFRKRFDPDAIAIQRLGSALSFGQLLEMVRGIACKLRQAGIRPGDKVVTCLPDLEADWVVTLALMHEAAVSCSNQGYDPIAPPLGARWVMSNRVLSDFPLEKTVLIDAAWLAELPLVPVDFEAHEYTGASSLFRLALTSGTTGQYKVVAFTLEQAMQLTHRLHPLARRVASDFCMIGLSSSYTFLLALYKLREGDTLYHALSVKEAIQAISAFQLETLWATPPQLAGLMAELARSSRRLTSLRYVAYGGVAASARFIERMRSTLCPDVRCAYGSTEAGLVAVFQSHFAGGRPGCAGFVLPDAEVEIVDEEQQPLGADQEGLVRVRAPFMAHEYHGDAEQTALSFRDDWFYPGDRGRLMSDGMLVLSGRVSELVNRGGVKVDPADLDHWLLEYAGIRDAAAFGFENHLGIEDLGAAVAVADGFDMTRMQADLLQALGRNLSPAIFVTLESIPRNAMGKPLRASLAQAYGDALRQKMSP